MSFDASGCLKLRASTDESGVPAAWLLAHRGVANL